MARWSEEDLTIAIEFYETCPERMHTDSHDKCVELARLLGRTPGALDRIIRNIKYADGAGAGLEHASELIYELVGRPRKTLLQQAAVIRQNRGWPPLDCSD